MFKKIIIIILLVLFSLSARAEEVKEAGKWCSLKSNTVNVRTGPGKRYPIKWVYKRKSLPLIKVAEYDNWIKIKDFEGTTGWVHPTMISGQHTFIVTSKEAELKNNSRLSQDCIAKIERGVIGKLVSCEKELCEVEINNWDGLISKTSIWGAE